MQCRSKSFTAYAYLAYESFQCLRLHKLRLVAIDESKASCCLLAIGPSLFPHWILRQMDASGPAKLEQLKNKCDWTELGYSEGESEIAGTPNRFGIVSKRFSVTLADNCCANFGQRKVKQMTTKAFRPLSSLLFISASAQRSSAHRLAWWAERKRREPATPLFR